MNGESKKSFAVALATFALGAILAGVLANEKTREKIATASKKLTSKAEVA